MRTLFSLTLEGFLSSICFLPPFYFLTEVIPCFHENPESPTSMMGALLLEVRSFLKHTLPKSVSHTAHCS
uniref:Uncharacterized protein n=1 Tax=Anguilla anguilla TaxID=7936 RepID=A0A0E9WW77_ANGAN